MTTPRRRNTSGPDASSRPSLQIVHAEAPDTVDAWEILRTKYPPMPWTVPGILPRDFNMLSGAPKAGKSWVALYFALKVATAPAPTPDSPAPSVLYVTPDDTDRANLQERINILLGGVPFDRGRLDMWDRHVPRLDEGLLDKLAAYLQDHPQCVYIVLDVWNALKPNRTTDDVQKHEHTAMEQFRDFAQQHGIGLTLLNHDNKRPTGQGSPRAMRISGSYGLLGGVQSYMTLERDEDSDKVLLFRRGRRGRDMYLEFRLDDLSVDWEPTILSEKPDNWAAAELAAEAAAAAAEREADEARTRPHVPGPIEQKILDTLADGREWRPKDLALATDVRRGTVREYLRRMLGRGQVSLVCGGVYCIAPVTPVTLVTPGADPGNDAAGNEAERGAPVTDVTGVTPSHDAPARASVTPETVPTPAQFDLPHDPAWAHTLATADLPMTAPGPGAERVTPPDTETPPAAPCPQCGPRGIEHRWTWYGAAYGWRCSYCDGEPVPVAAKIAQPDTLTPPATPTPTPQQLLDPQQERRYTL